MSKIAVLGKNNSNLLNILKQYDDELEKAADILKFDGKTLDTCLKEQVAHEVYYSQRRTELKVLLEHFDNEVDKIKAKFIKKMKNQNMRDISDRMLLEMAKDNEEYNILYGLYLEVKEVAEKYTDVVNAFTSRGYALGHLTKARVASVHGDII